MTTHITKTWFDGEKVVTQEIHESEVYKQEPVAWVNRGENIIERVAGWDGYGALYTTPPAAQESGPVSIKKVAEGHGMNLPTEFVPKRDESKAAIRSLTDQCAALIQERDELQKRVWQYEKLTPPAAQREPAPGYCKHCKQYTIEEPLPAAQREWVGLTDEEAMQIWGLVVKYAPSEVRLKSFARLIRDKLKEKNNG